MICFCHYPFSLLFHLLWIFLFTECMIKNIEYVLEENRRRWSTLLGTVWSAKPPMWHNITICPVAFNLQLLTRFAYSIHDSSLPHKNSSIFDHVHYFIFLLLLCIIILLEFFLDLLKATSKQICFTKKVFYSSPSWLITNCHCTHAIMLKTKIKNAKTNCYLKDCTGVEMILRLHFVIGAGSELSER